MSPRHVQRSGFMSRSRCNISLGELPYVTYRCKSEAIACDISVLSRVPQFPSSVATVKRKVPCHVHLTSRVCFTMLGNFLNCRTVLRCPTHFLLRNLWTRARKRPGYSAEPPERPVARCLRSRVYWFCHRSCAGEVLSREHQVSLCRALNKDTFEDRYKCIPIPFPCTRIPLGTSRVWF